MCPYELSNGLYCENTSVGVPTSEVLGQALNQIGLAISLSLYITYISKYL
ncbi:hypothetical protein [Leptospira alexanderi]|nr:hypothetical protein [Leptospira alexanderi]